MRLARGPDGPASVPYARRNGPGRLYNVVVVSAMGTGSQERRTIDWPRGERGAALAFLRHPAKASATIASPAIQAA